MNTTMADGAEKRLDAQQDERARFEAWAGDFYHIQRMGDTYRSAITTNAWQAWQAALAAQPSPGGQDALLGYVRVEAIKALGEDDEVTGVMVHVEERADSVPVYLAARQPVTMDDALSAGDGTLHGAIDHWQERALRAEAELAARQPVGESMWVEIRREGDRTFPRVMKKHHAEAFLRTCNVGPLPTIHALYAAPPAQQRGEPVAWMDPDGSRVLTAKAKANASGAYKSATSGYTVPLYPPAQAVDLGPDRFRDPDHLAEWLGSLVDGSEQEEWDAAQAAMIGVRAFQQHPAVIERLREAVEGECDGLAITDEQAAAIFDHVLEPSPLIDGKAVGK
ncbi:TPA: hypothetical protein UOA92_000365 [Stenotrophomonas maltophilia]|nr:hypothetical protein [Stenotrophomonas maltophilia]